MDQSPSFNNTTYVGASGGLVTINADTNPNQQLLADTGIRITDGPPGSGTHTFLNTGVVSVFVGENGPYTGSILFTAGAGITIDTPVPGQLVFAANVASAGVTSFGKAGTPRTGDIVVAAGSGVTITEAPDGTFTFASTATGGVASVGLAGTPRTGAIVLAPGANVTITESPNGTYTFATTAVAGVASINGDTTNAQVVAGTAPVVVTNAGANHTISVSNFSNVGAGSAGLVPNPVTTGAGNLLFDSKGWLTNHATSSTNAGGSTAFNGVGVIVGTINVVNAGFYLITGIGSISRLVTSPSGWAAVIISVAGSPVATCSLGNRNDVDLGINVSTCQFVPAGGLVTLTVFQVSGENLVTRPSQLHCVLLYGA